VSILAYFYSYERLHDCLYAIYCSNSYTFCWDFFNCFDSLAFYSAMTFIYYRMGLDLILSCYIFFLIEAQLLQLSTTDIEEYDTSNSSKFELMFSFLFKFYIDDFTSLSLFAIYESYVFILFSYDC
jgi:hypothetical protein